MTTGPPNNIGDCPLCGSKGVEIRESHIIPKWAYRRLFDENRKNPHPMVVSKGKAIQSSKQYKERMLCSDCEQKLGKSDKWASQVLYQEDGSAPLLTRTARDQSGAWLNISDDEAEKLIRFCVSILWRSHQAKSFETSLGSYAEQVRAYLDDSTPLPSELALIAFFHESSPGGSEVADLFCGVNSQRNPGFHQHRFVLFGLDGVFAVGQQVPAVYRKYCLIQSRHRRVLLEQSDEIIEWFAKPFAEAMVWRMKRGYELPTGGGGIK